MYRWSSCYGRKSCNNLSLVDECECPPVIGPGEHNTHLTLYLSTLKYPDRLTLYSCSINVWMFSVVNISCKLLVWIIFLSLCDDSAVWQC